MEDALTRRRHIQMRRRDRMKGGQSVQPSLKAVAGKPDHRARDIGVGDDIAHRPREYVHVGDVRADRLRARRRIEADHWKLLSESRRSGEHGWVKHAAGRSGISEKHALDRADGHWRYRRR